MKSSSKAGLIRIILAAILVIAVIGGVVAYVVSRSHSIGTEPSSGSDSTRSSSESLSGTILPGTEPSSEATATEKPGTSAPTVRPSTPSSSSTSASASSNYAYAYAGFSPKLVTIDENKWYLTLVNRDYILPDGYEPKLAKTVIDIYGGYDRGYLDYRVAPHFIEMYNAALEEGLKLSPLSGYRSVERQRNNFENLINDYVAQGYSKAQATVMASEIILPPSTSEHNAGLAMDILSLETSFERSNEFAWLSEHAADYGFILRYPKDKQKITKITYEPWHWRYVGVTAAKAMKASGQCLEEYLGIA